MVASRFEERSKAAIESSDLHHMEATPICLKVVCARATVFHPAA